MTTGTLRVIGAPRATVIVHRMPPPPDAVLRNIPAEAGVHTVVVAARPAPDVGTLASLLAGRLPVGCKVVRLVLSDGARNNLAGELADRLRLTVVAPDGPALLLESGTLFVPGGAWHEYRPSRRTGRLGARLPAPAWQAALDPLPKALGGLAYIEVPAGLWLRPVEFAGETLPVSALAVPVDPDRAAILVGHPDAPPAGPETMDTLLGLPRGIRRRLTLIPYGRDSMRVHEMAERLAVHGADVEAANGVPGAATLDDDGSPGWQPSGEVFGYRAANAPVLRQPVKAGFWSIGDGWGVEIVRSGWLVRSLREDAETDAARRLLPHSAHPLVVLTSAVSEDAELADRLVRQVANGPAFAARPLLRLAVTRPPADGAAPGWGRLIGQYGELLCMTSDGALITLPAGPSVSGRAPVPRVTGRAPARRFTEGPAVIDAEPDPVPNDAAVVGDKSMLDSPAALLPQGPLVPLSLADATGRVSAARVSIRDMAPSRPVQHQAASMARPSGTAFAAPLAMSPVPRLKVSPGRRAPGEYRLVAEDTETLTASTGTAALLGRALPAGAVPVAWEPPPDLGWRPGIAYTSSGMLGGGLAAPETNIVVWAESARPVPRGGGAVLFPLGARFALVERTGQAVLLLEIGDGDPGDPTPAGVLRALRRAAVARSRDQS